MKLSEVIIKYRQEHDLSQRQMAAKCKLSTGYISLIEKEINPQTGRVMIPSLVVLNKLAQGMSMNIDSLLSICDDMPVSIKPIEKPATVTDSEFEEIKDIFFRLSPDNRSKLLELCRLFLNALNNNEENK